MIQIVKNKLKNQKGFTLIELLAVIVILGIIAAIAVPSISKIIDQSKLSAIRSDAQQILNSAKLYSADKGLPASGKYIDQTDLSNYIDNATTFSDGYKITFSGETPYLTGTGTKDNKTIAFSKASLSDINATTDKSAAAITGAGPDPTGMTH